MGYAKCCLDNSTSFVEMIWDRSEPCEKPEKKKTECLAIMTCERNVKGIIA